MVKFSQRLKYKHSNSFGGMESHSPRILYLNTRGGGWGYKMRLCFCIK